VTCVDGDLVVVKLIDPEKAYRPVVTFNSIYYSYWCSIKFVVWPVPVLLFCCYWWAGIVIRPLFPFWWLLTFVVVIDCCCAIYSTTIDWYIVFQYVCLQPSGDSLWHSPSCHAVTRHCCCEPRFVGDQCHWRHFRWALITIVRHLLLVFVNLQCPSIVMTFNVNQWHCWQPVCCAFWRYSWRRCVVCYCYYCDDVTDIIVLYYRVTFSDGGEPTTDDWALLCDAVVVLTLPFDGVFNILVFAYWWWRGESDVLTVCCERTNAIWHSPIHYWPCIMMKMWWH